NHALGERDEEDRRRLLRDDRRAATAEELRDGEETTSSRQRKIASGASRGRSRSGRTDRTPPNLKAEEEFIPSSPGDRVKSGFRAPYRNGRSRSRRPSPGS